MDASVLIDDGCRFDHGMTKSFVHSLRQLFDIIDYNKTGFIQFAEIACRWEEKSDDPDFPKGLINCLMKVTPANGLISFERLCAAIRICLLKNQADIINNNNNDTDASATPPPAHPPPPPPIPPHQNLPLKSTSPLTMPQPMPQPPYHLLSKTRGASFSAPNQVPEVIKSQKPTASISPVPPQPLVKNNNNSGNNNSGNNNSGNNNSGNSEYTGSDSSFIFNVNNIRSKSMPQLQLKNNAPKIPSIRYQSDAKLIPSKAINDDKLKSNKQRMTQPATLSRSCIMKTLQNWRDNVLGRQLEMERISSSSESKENLMTDTELDAINFRNQIHHKLPPLPPPPPLIQHNGPAMRRAANKRREPRRHTVGSNGIDYNSIRRMQQIEQEREIFLQGLEAVERAREWYFKNLSMIQEKLMLYGRVGTHPADYSLDAYQERVKFQAARILTVNQHLAALIDGERAFPLHMNLAMRSITSNSQIIRNSHDQKPQLVTNPNVVNRLKEQNRLLTDEVSKKSEKITQLEREKAALIRELFHARTLTVNKNRGENDDTTFM